jgi:cell division protein FtsZ
MRLAESGICELQKHVDTLIVIPNQNLFRVANERTTFAEAFSMADQVLYSGVASITDLMVKPGLINLDFADVRTVMRDMGKAMMGTGEATGERRAIEAAEAAIANPLLDEVSMRGAKGVIINITGGEDLKLMEVDEAANHIREMVDPDANIIVGSAFNETLQGKMRVSVVATGIDVGTETQSVPQATRTVTSFGAVAGSFGGGASAPRRGEPAPKAPEPQPEKVMAKVEEPVAEIEEVAEEPQALPDNVMPLRMPEAEHKPEPVAAEPVAERTAAPIAEVAERPYVAPAPREEKAASGPTLFERMMNLSRGPEKARDVQPDLIEEEPEVEQDPLEIPRFFRRQVND